MGIEVSLCLGFYVAFLKKSSAKNFLAERFLRVFKKSTLNRDLFSVERLFLLLNYAIGVCGLKFNITNIEFSYQHCRPVERTIFENSPKSFLLESFWR
ncbi:MAG: hypothetical protein IIX30_02200, partial [Clostridia bacterium]|nr:hypothetical protein [Clostridia bacterium]